MKPIDIAQRYASAFNAHDIPGIVSTFADDGVYKDPIVAQGVTTPGLADYVSGLIKSIPDLRFDLVRIETAGRDLVILEWIMRGINTGPLPEGPATNRPLALPGIDVINVESGKIASLTAYFDRMTYAEQLGLMPANSGHA